MYCRNCGKEVNDKAVACPACGVPPLCERKFCQSCGTTTQTNQAICVKCGVSLAGGNIQSVLARISGPPVRGDARRLQVTGAIGVGFGLFIGLWARSHSPHMDFMEMMSKADSFVLKEPIYYVILIVAVLIGLAGVMRIIKSFIPGKSE